jgi:two-component system, OmpR family, response regulator
MRPRPRILVVDDEVNVARTLEMILDAAGYSLNSAHSGAEAITLLTSAQRFDIVLTDLNMEKSDTGLDVAQVASQLEPRPVIVIFTGFPDDPTLKRARETQLVDDIIVKPVPIDELLGVLGGLLSRSRQAATGS